LIKVLKQKNFRDDPKQAETILDSTGWASPHQGLL